MRVTAVLVLAFCGCQDSRFRNKPVQVPDSKVDVQAGLRVDQTGRQILAANVFCGVDVGFVTIDKEQPVLFHRGQESVFISNSLVNRCKTDEELAAVLCHELGKMVAEKRNAERMGFGDLSIDFTLTNSGEAATAQQRPPAPSGDSRRIAIGLLKTTGIDEQHYPKAEQLLKGLNKNRDMIEQLDGGKAPPTWSN